MQPPEPKPYLTYGFPIGDPYGQSARGFRQHESVTNFSIEVLGDLRIPKGFTESLVSSPVSGVLKWSTNKNHVLNQSDRVCFPWAVVELAPTKAEESPIQSCYCQAANSASAALSLLENLHRRAGLATRHSVESVPPVIAITCSRSEIRVWLAFAAAHKSKPVLHVGFVERTKLAAFMLI
jgi:hypothetical protein